MRIPGVRTIHPEVVRQLLVGEDPFRVGGRLLVLADGDVWNRRLARWNAWHAGSLVCLDQSGIDAQAVIEGDDGALVERDVFDLAMRQTQADWSRCAGPRSKAYGLEEFASRAGAEYRRAAELRGREEGAAVRSFVLVMEGWLEEMDHLELEHAVEVLGRLTSAGVGPLLWVLGLLRKHYGVSDVWFAAALVGKLGVDAGVVFQAELAALWMTTHSVGGHVMTRRWMRRLLSQSGLGSVVVDITEPLWNLGPSLLQQFRSLDVYGAGLEAVEAAQLQPKEAGASRSQEAFAAVMAEAVDQLEGLMDPALLGERGRLELAQHANASAPGEALGEVLSALVRRECDREVWFGLWAAHVRDHVHPLYGVEGIADKPVELLFEPVLEPLVAAQVAEVVLRWRHELAAAKGQELPAGMVLELRSLEWVLVAKWNGEPVEWEQQDPESRGIWDGMGALPELVWPGRRGLVCRDWRVLELLRPVAYCAVESLMKACGFLGEEAVLASERPGWLGDLWDPNQGGLTFRTALAGAMQASARVPEVLSDEERRRFFSVWALACGVGLEEVQDWMAVQTFELSDLVAYARYLAGRPGLANRFGGLGETLYVLDHFKPAWVVGPLSRVA